jgi:hypothetical protein
MHQYEDDHAPAQGTSEGQFVVMTPDRAKVLTQQDKHFKRNITICSSAIGVTSLALLAFACGKGYTQPAEGFADEFGALVGHAFWVALGFLLLWRTIPRDKKRLAACCFVLIVSAIAVYKSVTLLRDVSDVRRTVETLSSILRNAGPSGQIAGERMNGGRHGKMTGVVALMTDWTRDLQSDADTTYTELDKCNLASIFSPEVLTQPDLLSKCQMDYQEAESVLNQHQKRVEERFGDFPSRVKSSSLSDMQKERLLSGWNKTKDENLKDALEFIEVQRAFVHEGISLLSFMKEKQAKYTYREKKIVFQSKEDAGTFGLFLGNLTRLSAQEASCVERVQRKAAIMAKELEQLAGGEAPR